MCTHTQAHTHPTKCEPSDNFVLFFLNHKVEDNKVGVNPCSVVTSFKVKISIMEISQHYQSVKTVLKKHSYSGPVHTKTDILLNILSTAFASLIHVQTAFCVEKNEGNVNTVIQFFQNNTCICHLLKKKKIKHPSYAVVRFN